MAQQNDSFFSRLTRLFRSGPSIRRKIKGEQDGNNFYDRKATIAARQGGNTMVPMRRGTGHNSPFAMMDGSDIVSRNARYAEFAEMEYTPILSKALDIQADEICSGDENGRNFHIYSDNAQVKEALDELFYDIVNVDFNLRPWARLLLKNGDLFLFNEVVPGQGVVNVMPLNVNEVEREEGYDVNDPYAVRFRWQRSGQQVLENWQITHFRIQGNDNFAPYGTSVLESSRRIWRQYVMMIDAMMVYRIIRSPERRVFYVDVGTVAVNDIPNYMNTVMSTIQGQGTIDKATGRMDERFNPTDVLENYIIPVRGANSGTKIDTLAGATNQTATDDIKILENQLFAACGTPKAYLNYDEMLSSKATLSQQDIRFSRTIQMHQKTIISELNKIAILHLYAKGFQGADLIDFKLRLSNPSSIAQQQKLDLFAAKIALVSAIDQVTTKFMPLEVIYKQIWDMSDTDIVEYRIKLQEDKRFAALLDGITSAEEETNGENTVDPFDPSSYTLPGGTPLQNTDLTSPPIAASVNGAPKPVSAIAYDQTKAMKLALSKGESPIKVSKELQRNNKNIKRQKTSLSSLAVHPDFNKMLNPSKNRSLRDVYDQDSLKSSLSENASSSDADERIDYIFGKTAYISKEMRGILEGYDKAQRVATNTLPVDIELLSEEEGAGLFPDVGFRKPSKAMTESDEGPDLEALADLGLGLKDSN